MSAVRVLVLAALLALAVPAAAGARAKTSGRRSRDIQTMMHPAHHKTFGGFIRDIPTGAHIRPSLSARAANIPYGGGPVLHRNRTHVIFWQPSRSGMRFEAGYETLIERFLTQVAADSRKPTNVYGLSGQYSDAFGPAAYDSTYGGAVVATDRLPPSQCVEPATGPGWSTCLTDEQLAGEIEHAVAADRLPTTGTDVYFLVTPDGLGDCIDSTSSSCALGGSSSGYCGYHSQGSQGILYAVIPYNAVSGHCQSDNPRPNGSTADPSISTLSHEHNELVTDPVGDAWVDNMGQEDGDLCIQSFGPDLGGAGSAAWNEAIHGGHYYLQEEWSNNDGACAPRDESNPISFLAPARMSATKPVSLSAHSSDPDGAIVGYNWFFGDGGSGRRRTVSHAFRRPGLYRVVLRTTDRSGNWASYSREVRVTKAPARTRGKRRPAGRPR